jgi:hypothetical protein
MTDTIVLAQPSARAQSRYFYFRMALVCLAVAFFGFLPTYWLPVARSTHFDPVVHFHGMIFFAWTIYFVFQTWIAANGQIARHRMAGLIGVSLATAMVIFGVLTTIHLVHGIAIAGHPEAAIQGAIVPLIDISCFAILVAAAFFNIPRPEWHKRLMLLAAMSILAAPIFRAIVVLGHVPLPPPFHVLLESEGVMILLCLVPILRDRYREGRVHPAYVWGFSGIVLGRLLQATLGPTAFWHAVGGWVTSLG